MIFAWYRQSFKQSRWPRRIGVALTILVLLPPLASLALHLYGRARFASAVSELEAVVGEPLVFDLAQLRTTTPPRQHNMAVWLVEGATAMELWTKEEIAWQSEAGRLPRDAWSPQLEAGVRSMVQRQSEALGILHEAAPLLLSDYGVPYDEVTANTLFLYLLDLLKAAKLLNLEARLAFADGDAAAGLLATQTLSRLASSLAKEPLTIHSLVALSCERYLLLVVREILESTEPWAKSPALVDQLEAHLVPVDLMASVQDSLISEAVWLTYRIRDEPQEGDMLPDLSWTVRHQLSLLIVAEILDVARQVVELSPVPYAEARGRLGDHPAYGSVLPETGPRLLDIFLSAAEDDDLQVNELVGRYISALFSKRSPATYRYGDDLTHTVYKTQRIASQRQLVSAAIAMRRIGIAEGSYPRQRPDLAVLDQPDAFAGRPVAYRLRDDGSLVLEIEDGPELSRQLFPRVDPSGETDVFSTILPPPQPMSGTKVSRHRRQEEERREDQRESRRTMHSRWTRCAGNSRVVFERGYIGSNCI